MFATSLFAIAVTIAAQGVAPPPPPVAAADGAMEAPVQPSTTLPSAAAAAPIPDAKPQGMDGVATAGAQMGAGVGACCVGGCVAIPCAFVPFVGPFLGSIVSGVIIGGTETVVGDALGQKRAAMLWPVLASSGILVAGGLVNLGIGRAFGFSSTVLDPNNLNGLGSIPSLALGVSVGVSLTTVVAAVVVPALIYQFTGVDKEPGDTGGFGVPGFVSPADPTGTRATKAATSPTPSPAPTASTPPATAPSTSPPSPVAY